MKNLLLLVFLTISMTSFGQYSAVRINMLGLATGTINAGIDVTVSDKWSLDVSGYWNPVKTEKLRTNILAAIVGVKRWRFEPHVGLFWGLHTIVAKYKVGRRHTRYNGWLTGVGSSLGYCWMLNKRWNFSIEGGLGVFYTKDTKWRMDTSPLNDIVLEHYRRLVVAPSKLELSFSYLF